MKMTNWIHPFPFSLWTRSSRAHGIYCLDPTNYFDNKETDTGAVEERLAQLVQMEEDCFIGGFHQKVENKQ